MIQPSSFLNNYTEEAFKDFRTRVLLDSGFFESEEGSKPNFAYNLSTLTTNLDSDTQEFLKATGIKDNTTISHINNYVVKLKRFGLWNKMKALYPFVSDNRNLASYTESATGVSTGTNGVLSTTEPSPTGSLNAVRVNNAGGNPYNFQNFTLAQNTQYTFSVYVRAVTGTVNFGMYINHSNGGLNLPITYFTATTTWQRFNITFNTATFPNNWYTVINFMTGNIEFWGWQLELGSTPTAYQPVLGLSSTVYSNHFKYNLKDPRDLDAAFRLTFSGGWQFSQLGITGNGANTFADTKLIPSVNLSQNSTHISIYPRTEASVGTYFVDMGVNIPNGLYLLSKWTSYHANNSGESVESIIAFSDSTGLFINNRVNSTSMQLWRNTTKQTDSSSITASTSTGLSGNSIYIGGYNNNNSVAFSNTRQYSFATIGDGLTDSEATNLYYLTEELQANLKRNVSPYNSFRGILDEYPGAAAAYSLRRLSGSYGGPLVKVRRSSDNTEQDIFPTASGSLDTTSLLSFVGANNGFVTTWYDQSGGGYNVTQATAGYQPQIVSSGTLQTILGKPTMLWDGIDDNLSQTLPVINGLSQIALISVTNPLGGSLGNMNSANLLFKETAGWGNVGQVSTPSGLNYRIGTSQSANNNFYYASINVAIHATYKNGVNEVDRYNGVDILTSNTKLTTIANTSNILDIGKDEYLGSYSGKQSEVIIYFTDQTTNRYKLESNINTYYNVFWDGSRKGLLDFYPNAAAAYSVRALSSSYRGPLIKVRRASDNTERDIFALQNGNLDTFTLATFCSGTDGFVTTWYDQSGVGRNATQSTAGSQPQIVSSGTVILENGKPTITHTSLTPLLLSSTLNLSTTYTMYGIAKFNAYDKELFGDSATGFSFSYGIYQNATESYHSAGGTFTAANFGAGYGLTFNLLTIERAGTTSVSIYKNANIFNTQTLNGNGNFYLSSLSGERGQSYIFSGNLSEAIFYSSNQSSNRTAISSNINTYYTIY